MRAADNGAGPCRFARLSRPFRFARLSRPFVAEPIALGAAQCAYARERTRDPWPTGHTPIADRPVYRPAADQAQRRLHRRLHFTPRPIAPYGPAWRAGEALPDVIDVGAIRDKLIAGRPLSVDERTAVLHLLPRQRYELVPLGADWWRAGAPGNRPAAFRSKNVGLRYLRHMAQRGDAPGVIDPTSRNPRQAVRRACKCAIDEIAEHCPALAGLLRRALSVGAVARLLLPPDSWLHVGNDLETDSAIPAETIAFRKESIQ